jgi:predicted permease
VIETLIGFLARAYASLLPSPGADRKVWADDAAATFRAVCREAYARGGTRGLCRTIAAEWIDLCATRVRSVVPTTRFRPRNGAAQRLLRDLRHACRALVSGRAAVTLAVVTLAAGIGLNTAIFSLLDTVLWRPVPYPNGDRLAQLASFNVARKFMYMGAYPPPLIESWRAERDLFDRVEGFDTTSVVYTGTAGAELFSEAVVTPDLLPLLGVAPSLGRIFEPGDGQSGSSNIVIVSNGFWRTRLGGDPGAVGRDLVIDGTRQRVVGVMPAAFRFPSGDTALWTPYDTARPPADGASARTLTPLVRIARGVTFAEAEQEARRRGGARAAAAGLPDTTAAVYRLAGYTDERMQQSLWVLGAAVGFLFLVVCANVANLALSRSIHRTREFAVRTALGASRGTLVRETLVEHALIAAAGCAAGVALAAGFLRLAVAVLPDSMTISALTPVALDGRAILFAAGLGSLAALVFGVPAALVASRPSVSGLLGGTSRASTGSTSWRRLRSALVVAEVCVSTALLVAAALTTRSLLKLEAADRGFDTKNLLSIRIGLPSAGYGDAAVRDRFVADAVDRLRHVPGIAMATVGDLPTNARPLMLGPVEFSSRPGHPTEPLIVPMLEVPSDYFSAVGIRLVAGRPFMPQDTTDDVIVSQRFANQFWPAGNAVGGRFRRDGQSWQRVIGVVGDVRPMSADGSNWGRRLMVYYQQGKAPAAMRPIMSASSIAEYRTLVVRASRPVQAVAALPDVIHAMDPHVVIARIALVEHLYADAIARPRTVFLLMTVFAIVGLALAAAGVYGVLSYLVSLRLREIGIRLALGARPADIGRTIVQNGVLLAMAGLAAGMALAFGLVRLMRALLYAVEPSDPLSFVLVAIVLLAASTAAAWRPARRAMRVDPVALLRQE